MIENTLINKLQNKRCKFIREITRLKIFVGFKIIYQGSNISWKWSMMQPVLTTNECLNSYWRYDYLYSRVKKITSD